MTWWAGSPEGPGPVFGESDAAELCQWQDAGPTLLGLDALLSGAGLPASFWTLGRGGDHHGIWGVDLWAANRLTGAPAGAHFDVVACPEATQVPANGGEVESDLPAVVAPSGRLVHLWLFFDTVPDPPGGELPPLIGEAWAAARLAVPTVETSPETVAGVADATVVNLATWLWIEPAAWHLVSATAAGGGEVATVWAVPVAVDWHAAWSLPSPGDDPEGGVTLAPELLALSCPGPGTPFTAAGAPGASACTATFDQSTFGTVQTLTASILWQVHWALSNAAGVVGGEGTLPAAVTTGRRALRVLQIESVVTSG